MFRLDGGRPGDERGFIHKKILGGISKITGVASSFVPIPGLGAVSQITGALARPKARAVLPRSQTARPTLAGQQGKELGRQLKFGPAEATPSSLVARVSTTARSRTALATTSRALAAPCVFPWRIDPASGECRLFLGEGVGPNGDAGVTAVGNAVMGQYGAALQPGTMVIERSVCLPGMQLAKDGLCYNKGAITNTQRMWPRGRRPLLTGGDMRAIGIAARAGAKLDRTTKRLRTLGMMKRLPAPKRAAPHAHAKPTAAVSV